MCLWHWEAVELANDRGVVQAMIFGDYPFTCHVLWLHDVFDDEIVGITCLSPPSGLEVFSLLNRFVQWMDCKNFASILPQDVTLKQASINIVMVFPSLHDFCPSYLGHDISTVLCDIDPCIANQSQILAL